MKTYIKNDFGIYAEDEFVPISHWKYEYYINEERKNKIQLVAQASPEATWEQIRQKRNLLLKQTDWVTNFDVNVSNKEQILKYRQQLRDITKNFDSPSNVKWPRQPN